MKWLRGLGILFLLLAFHRQSPFLRNVLVLMSVLSLRARVALRRRRCPR